jgi:hypothetical protein
MVGQTPAAVCPACDGNFADGSTGHYEWPGRVGYRVGIETQMLAYHALGAEPPHRDLSAGCAIQFSCCGQQRRKLGGGGP